MSSHAMWPEMYRVHQRFARPELPDPVAELREKLVGDSTFCGLRAGARVAIAVGSRGISGVSVLLRALVSELLARQAQVLIVPAMGSQGGGTPEGQTSILRGLGVRQDNILAPIRPSHEVVTVGESESGLPLFCDRSAADCDLLVVVNRVKPHTAFRGDIESGIMKMLAVGLGRTCSAEVIHQSALGLAGAIVDAARSLLVLPPPKLGVAIVENAYGGIARLEVLDADSIERGERQLLAIARDLMPALPCDQADMLIVEKMGKDVSGAGMDPNIIGMQRRIPSMVQSTPRLERVVALDLTDESQGNAEGVGLADIITRRLREKIDLAVTYRNCITSGFLRGGMIPITMASDQEAICLALSGLTPEYARVMRIRDTGSLVDLDVSRALLGELAGRGSPEVVAPLGALRFDPSGTLVSTGLRSHEGLNRVGATPPGT
jgi:hypothetical protein